MCVCLGEEEEWAVKVQKKRAWRILCLCVCVCLCRGGGGWSRVNRLHTENGILLKLVWVRAYSTNQNQEKNKQRNERRNRKTVI